MIVQSYKSAEKMDLGPVSKLQLLYCACSHMIKIQALGSLPIFTIVGYYNIPPPSLLYPALQQGLPGLPS